MAERISIGDQAPDFDLSSTEDALLTLRDEVPRKAVLLYFFADPAADRVRRDLEILAQHREALSNLHAKILVVSTAKMPVLKALQGDLKLPFPVLRDDRDFFEKYGVISSGEEDEPSPALFLVSRRQTVLWLANPVASVEDAMAQAEQSLRGQGSPTTGYPKSVINRLVDRWVN